MTHCTSFHHSMGSLTQPKLSVIDFTTKHLEAGSSSWLSTREDVVRALEECGCFIAIYDKVPLELHEALFQASQQLFDLPTETKVSNTADTISLAYTGQMPVVPLFEALDIENATALEGAQKFTNRMWPYGNQPFSETTFLFPKLVSELDQMVMRMAAEKYGIEKHYDSMLGSTGYILRLIKYRSPKGNETNVGLIPHTDKSFMSILHQSQVKGLERKTKDGEWFIVDPSPSSFIVMAGDACMAWTNGRIESPQHRVIISEDKDRYSVALFTFMRRDFIIQVPKELVDEEHPLQFNPFDHYKFLDFYFTDEGRRSRCPIKAYCGVSTDEIPS